MSANTPSGGAKFSMATVDPQTPGGVSLTPIELKDTIQPVDDDIARAAAEEAFTQDVQSSFDMGSALRDRGLVVPEMPNPLSLQSQLLNEAKQAYEQSLALEKERVEDVLFDIVPNYAGTKKEGVLNFGDRDTLARMRKFEQRQAWFKRKFPNGELFRVETGTDGDLVELYKTSPQGKVYRVSNDVLSFADMGAGTGALLNFTTAGSVIGSVFSPLLGTAGGAYIGATIDDYIANSLADGTFTGLGIETEEQFNTRFLAGDRAVLALTDGVITKALPGMGRGGAYLAKRFGLGEKPDGSLLYELGIFSVNPKAAQAQAAAQRLAATTGAEIEPLNVSQLSNNILLRGIASQVSGTAGTLPKNLSKAEGNLLTALSKKWSSDGGSFDKFSHDEINKFIQLTNKGLADDTFATFRFFQEGNYALRDFPDAATSLIQRAKEVDAGYARAIDDQYQAAFSLAGAENVTFDLTNVLSTAQRIADGIPVTKLPPAGRTKTGKPLGKDKNTNRTVFIEEQSVRSREYGGDLKSLTDRLLKVFDPTVKNFKIKGVAGESDSRTVSSFQQLKDIRDQAQDLVNMGEGRALDLVKSIDDLILNGVENGLVKGGSDAWRKAYIEAGALVKQRNDVKNFTQVGQIFGSKKADIVPLEVAEGLINGKLNVEQFGIIKRMANSTALNETERQAGRQLITDIQDASLAYLLRNSDNAAEKIATMKKVDDGVLFNQLFPNEQIRAQLGRFEDTARLLATDPAQAVLKSNADNASLALQYVRSAGGKQDDLAIKQFIDANGGINGELADQMRAAILRDILEKNPTVKLDPTSDVHADMVINSEALSRELAMLKEFKGPYANFKYLFSSKVDTDGTQKILPTAAEKKYLDLITDAQLYSSFLATTADVGGPFATGAIRSAITSAQLSGTLRASKTLLTNKVLANIFGSKPSIEQLERAVGQRTNNARMRAAITLFNQWADGLNLTENIGVINTPVPTLEPKAPPGFETPAEEEIRTNVPPNLGTPVASLSMPPPAKPMQMAGRGTGITNFSSLFPQDELGGAIANRRNQGIMGIV